MARLRMWLCLRGFHQVFINGGRTRITCIRCGLFVGMRTYAAYGKTPPPR